MKVLRPRPDGIHQVFRLRGRHHEDHAVRRFFQCFQQGIGGFAREHVSLSRITTLLLEAAGAYLTNLAQLADLVNAAFDAASISITSSEVRPQSLCRNRIPAGIRRRLSRNSALSPESSPPSFFPRPALPKECRRAPRGHS